VLSTLASNTSKVEDPVRGALAEPVVVSGRTALPKGTELSGTVTDVKESGRVKGKAMIAFRFERLLFDSENHRIETARVTIEAQQKKSDDVKKGGVGAGLGAVVGGIAGGGKGAAIGAVAGGTATVLATKGGEVQVAPGTVVTAHLQNALTVRVPNK
jgi:L-aminopeptidase/D-esterase-like protein